MSNNRKIISNTLFLYFRMLLILLIALYSTRVVFTQLGVDDFGLYNLIASFVILFSFMNGAMRSAIQRYININILNDKASIRQTLSSSIVCQIFISVLFIFLAETIGLWCLNNTFQIPEKSVYAANIIYQFSIATVVFNLMSTPYQALILAKEKMKIYAYIGIFEALSKLLVAICLILFNDFNLLILYGFLIFLVALFVNIIYVIYARVYFSPEVKMSFNDMLLSNQKREIFQFSSWSLLGQLCSVCSRQGIAIIFNIFYGLKLNASIAIANQVNSIIYNFISNFQVAFNPQITQSFSISDIDRHKQLVINTSRYSLYLIAILSIPFFTSSEFILKIWLGNGVPVQTNYFILVILLSSMFEAASGPLWMSAHAIGNIKKYQLVISFILIMSLPLAYSLILLGFSEIFSFSSILIVSLWAYFYRFKYFCKKFELKISKMYRYLKDIFSVFCFIIILFLFNKIILSVGSYIDFIVINSSCFVLLLVFIWIFSLEMSEKKLILNFFKKINFFR